MTQPYAMGTPRVEIRAPLVARIVSGLMVVVGIVVFLGGSVWQGFRTGDWAAALFMTAFLTAWVTLIVRTARVAVLSTPDGRLVVRNQLRSKVLDRSQIEGVRRSADGFFSPTQGAFQLLLADGSALSLQATVPPPFGLARRRSEAQLDMLRRWLA